MKYSEQDIKRIKEQAHIRDLLVIVKLQVGKTDWEEIHTVVNFIYFRQIGIVITNQSKYYSANTLLLDEFLWLRIRITLMEISRLPP